MGLCFDFGAILEGHPDVLLAVNGDVVDHCQPVGIPELRQRFPVSQLLQIGFNLVPSYHALGNQVGNPDLIVMTEKGKIVLIETKGDHLDNEQNRKKLSLSRKWQEKAGEQFRYYMVFQEKAPELDGAYTFDKFLEMLGKL